MSISNQSQQKQKDRNELTNNGNDLSHPIQKRKVSNEQLQQIRKLSYENPGQLRKISYEKNLKDPIEILKLNKKTRTKEQLTILCQFLKEFQNLKIIQNESSFTEKVSQFVDKTTYLKLNKGDFIFHNMDKNDFYYFVLKGEIAAYAKKSESNINRSSSPPIQLQQLGTQSTQSPQSQNVLQKVNSSQQQQDNNTNQQLEKQSSLSEGNPQNISLKDDDLSLLMINNEKVSQYFEKEGKGRVKYNRIQVYKERSCFGDLSKKFKTFSAVTKSDQVELLRIQNKDFTHIFDFFEKKLAITIQILRKQFEGLISDRILINLSYLFEDAGEVLTTGEYVYRESDVINKIFIVKEGHLDLVKRAKNMQNKNIEKKISIISAGELFGYESLQSIQEDVKDGNDKEILYTSEGEEAIQKKEEVVQHHRFACKSTIENASIYYLDLNMIRRHDSFEEFLNHLTRLGVKKAVYYEERLQKMLQVEEKQRSEQASLSPSKIRDQKLSFKEAVSGIIERKSTNMYEGYSPSQQSLSHINDELISPQLKKKISSNREKGDQSSQVFQFSRQSSNVFLNSSSRNPSETYSPEQSPQRKNQTFNVLPYGHQQSIQLFAETIPERDELPTITTNQIKLSLQKNRNSLIVDENNKVIQQNCEQIKYSNLNNSRNSFSSTYEAGFQLKPIYSNRKKNEQYIPSVKLNSSISSPDKLKQISPFSSPIKLRTMRIYDSINNQLDSKAIKGYTTEKENLSKKNVIKVSSSTQLDELYSQVNRNALRISSQDTPESFEKQMKQQLELKLQRQDSGRLLQRKRDNQYLTQNPSSINVHEVQELLKIKEDIVQSQNIPKIVQLVSSGLPTFEESEKIQRLLKKSNTKAINANVSMNAASQMTKNSSNYSPRQKKQGSNNSPNISNNNHSLNVSISKIMKNKMNNYSELNESQASQEKLSKNEINSPIKIKSFQKLNFFDDEDMQQGIGSQSSPNLLRIKYPNSRNSSPLASLNQEQEIEDQDSSSNIFKYTCESPKLKLQLRQTAIDPSDFHTINTFENSTKLLYQQPVAPQEDNFNHSKIQDTILTVVNKSNNSKGKSFLKQAAEQIPEYSEYPKIPVIPLPKVRNISGERNIKNLTAKLQEATSGSPLKNVNLINSLGNRRYSSLGGEFDIQKNSKHNNNLFPNFLNNRVSIITSTGNADTQPSRNTRSSSGSQKRIKEATPLVLKPEQSENGSNNNTNNINSTTNASSRVTLQTGEQKNRKNLTLTFNQNLLKKSLIRQSLHKKYAQVVSSSPFRDKIILIQNNSEEQHSIKIGGINGQTINETQSNTKTKRIKLNDLNSNFIMDQKNIFPTSLENSRTISQSLHNSNVENKQSNNNSSLQQSQQRGQQQQFALLQAKTLAQQIRFNSVERLRNINSLHQYNTPEKFDKSIKNISVTHFNNQSIGPTSTNTPDRSHLAPLKKHTTVLTILPARQATLQSLHNLISSQKKEESSLQKNIPLAQINSVQSGSLYQNINQILKPIHLSQPTFREKKGFSLHSNY